MGAQMGSAYTQLCIICLYRHALVLLCNNNKDNVNTLLLKSDVKEKKNMFGNLAEEQAF